MKPGERFVAKVGFDRLDEAARTNLKAGAHLWIIMPTYGLTDQEAAAAREGLDTLLDRDHLLAVTPIGCYLCEQPYDKSVGKPCVPVGLW